MDFNKESVSQSVVDYFENLKNPTTFAKNYLTLMKTLGSDINLNLSSIEEIEPEYRNMLVGPVLERDQGCHQTCSNFAQSHNLNYYFGFADQYRLDGTYVHTFCHSFLCSPDNKKLYDPHIEFLYIERFPGCVKNHFGVFIPNVILGELLDSATKQDWNIGGFIKNHILVSDDETELFIKKIQSLNQ